MALPRGASLKDVSPPPVPAKPAPFASNVNSSNITSTSNSMNAPAPPSAYGGAPPPLHGRKLADLLKDIDVRFELEPEADDLLQQMGDDFLEKVIRPAILLAKHRNSSSLDVKDLALILERQWDIRVPNVHGTVPRPPPPYVRPPAGTHLVALGRRSKSSTNPAASSSAANAASSSSASLASASGSSGASQVSSSSSNSNASSSSAAGGGAAGGGGKDGSGRSASPPPPSKKARVTEKGP